MHADKQTATTTAARSADHLRRRGSRPLAGGSVRGAAPSSEAGEMMQLHSRLNAGVGASQLGALSQVLQRRRRPSGTGGDAVVQRVGGQTTGYNPDTIAKPEFKDAVKNLFAVARRVNRLRKSVATKANLTALSGLAEPQKGPQVKNVYAAALTDISLDIPWLTTVLTNAGTIDAILQSAKAGDFIKDPEITEIKNTIGELKTKVQIVGKDVVDLTWKKADGGEQPKAPILEGDAAFAPKAAASPATGIFRPTFKKLGKEGNQEYVKDDFGTHTRRFAYMEKSYHQVMAYQEQGFLAGKTQDLIGAATGTRADTVDPTNFNQQYLTDDEKHLVKGLGGKTAPADSRRKAMAYAHQWKGSGPGQRGLSLTSTPKEDAVFGNAGDSFRSDDGAKFEIDLAKVNPANNILINHYSAGSATRSQLGAGAGGADRRIGGHYQYERSVIKNRELYLQKVTPQEVTSITPHAHGANVGADSGEFIRAKQARIALTMQRDQKSIQLQQAQQSHADAQQQVQNSRDEINWTNNKLNEYRGLRGAKMTLNDGSVVVAWPWLQNHLRQWQQILSGHQQAVTNQQAIVGRLTRELQALNQQLAASAANPHAKKGEDTGDSYMEGYRAGLAARARGGQEKQKINDIFKGAYGDHNKYTPYWQGYGDGLNTRR